MIRFKGYLLLGIGFILLITPGFVKATSYDLPEPLVGQAEITNKDGSRQWFGVTGNEAVFNYDPEVLLGFERHHFVADKPNCYDDGIAAVSPFCFFLDRTSAINIMNSRTELNGAIVTETAALFWPENLINGDVYGLTNVLPLFAQVGKHLYQSGGTIGNDSTAFYKTSRYQFNPAAQAYWRPLDGSNRNLVMTDTIARLKQNAKNLTWDPLSGIFDGICAPTTNCPESAQYPDGRFWLTSRAVNVNVATLSYQKKSTIIIDNAGVSRNLVIDASIGPVNSADLDSNIGFIVKNGDVTITNSSGKLRKIYASMFVPNGNIIVTGSNIELHGSFIAKDFQVNPSSTNIKFLQDTRAESKWPPGFREMRSITTTSN